MTTFLSKEYWQSRYINNQTGWDINFPSPQITTYFKERVFSKEVSILIPGCGNAHEAIELLKMGYTNVHILDIAEEPLNNLRDKLQNEPYFNCLTFHNIDFFKHTGSYDYIIEQTFFCALDRKLRQLYVSHIANLLKPYGILMGLLFATEFTKEGPPFGGSFKEYEAYFKPYFNFLNFDIAELSIPQRQGNEFFIEFKKSN